MPKRNELAERLEVALRGRVHAEVARRIGTSAPNVSRYLRGTRVPADFCAALVNEFGVNANWLLTGKGAPFSAEIAASGEQLAGSLLELVEAMNVVARMRIGAVSSQRQGRMLRELSDATRNYERVRDKLFTYSQPVLEQLIKELGVAMRKRDMPQVEGLLQTADQVAKFCEDPDMLLILDSLRAEHHWRVGRRDVALRMQESNVRRALLGQFNREEYAYIQVSNFAVALTDRRRLREARRIIRAALAFGEELGPRWRAITMLRGHLGAIEIELGNLRDGLMLLHHSHSMIREVEQKVQATEIQAQRGMIERTQLLSGALTLAEMLGREFPEPWFPGVIRFACWLEDPALLEAACGKALPASPHPDAHTQVSFVAAPFLRDALAGKSRARKALDAALAELHEDTPILRFMVLVLRAQVARAAKAKAESANLTAEAEKLHATLRDEFTAPLEIRATHYRNMLESGDESAREFFKTHAAAGYHCFNRFA